MNDFVVKTRSKEPLRICGNCIYWRLCSAPKPSPAAFPAIMHKKGSFDPSYSGDEGLCYVALPLPEFGRPRTLRNDVCEKFTYKGAKTCDSCTFYIHSPFTYEGEEYSGHCQATPAKALSKDMFDQYTPVKDRGWTGCLFYRLGDNLEVCRANAIEE